MNKSKVMIGDTEYNMVVINQKQKEIESSSVQISAIHHIHIIDRSLSMSYEINTLIDNVKETIKVMSDNDYVSIIWFSGVGKYRTLIKGAKKDTSGLFDLLDSIKSTIGLTCFSESLQETNEIIEEMHALCPNFSVTMFTDGETVTSEWSSNEERSRVMNELEKMSDNILAFNTIGYGYYYDKEMLTSMSSKSQFGEYRHSSDISDYSEIFKHNYEKISELVVECVEITSDDNMNILYITRNTSKLLQDEMFLNAIDTNKNQFFLFYNTDFTFNYNGEEYDTSEMKVVKINEKTLLNFYYTLAYEQYYQDVKDKALDTLVKHTGDKELIDNMLNAYTYEEQSEYINTLKRCTFYQKHRYKEGKVESNYLPEEDHVCVMDILNILCSDDNYYIPTKNYKRIGEKTVDEFNLFEKTGDGITAFNELTYNKKMMNVSVLFKVDGHVNLNPVQAKKLSMPNKIDSRIYRNHTIIKDGNLNIPVIEAKITLDTVTDIVNLEEMWNVNIIDNIYGNENHANVTLLLNNLPVINKTYIKESNSLENILNVVKTTKLREIEQKVVKYYINQLKEDNKELLKEGVLKDYTVEQIDFLKEHGLDGKLNYGGVSRTVDSGEKDFYEAKVLEYQIKGWATIPSVNDAIKKGDTSKKDPKKKVNAVISYMYAYNNALPKDDINYLNTKLESIKKELYMLRSRLFINKLAKVLTGSWYTGLEVDKKGNYLYAEGDDTLIMKVQKEKVYF